MIRKAQYKSRVSGGVIPTTVVVAVVILGALTEIRRVGIGEPHNFSGGSGTVFTSLHASKNHSGA